MLISPRIDISFSLHARFSQQFRDRPLRFNAVRTLEVLNSFAPIHNPLGTTRCSAAVHWLVAYVSRFYQRCATQTPSWVLLKSSMLAPKQSAPQSVDCEADKPPKANGEENGKKKTTRG